MAVFLTVASYAFIALISYLIYLVHFQYTYWKKRGMLYIKPMPIFGNTAPVFFRTSSYPDYLLQLYRTYSDVRYFGFFHFGVPLVMVKDADLLREILVKNFDHFVNHKAFITEQMDPVIGRNLFTLEDQRWRDVRSKLSPSFTASRMKFLFELIEECANDFVNHFIENPEVIKINLLFCTIRTMTVS